MSHFVRPVSANVAFLASAAVYVNSSILMKLAPATLNAVSILKSIIERGSSSVIFSRMTFVIGRRFRFLLGLVSYRPFDECHTRVIETCLAEAPVDVIRLKGREIAQDCV